VQKAVGRLTSVVIFPARRSAEWINGTAEAVARTRSRVGTVAGLGDRRGRPHLSGLTDDQLGLPVGVAALRQSHLGDRAGDARDVFGEDRWVLGDGEAGLQRVRPVVQPDGEQPGAGAGEPRTQERKVSISGEIGVLGESRCAAPDQMCAPLSGDGAKTSACGWLRRRSM
jgi:hypothetical protein